MADEGDLRLSELELHDRPGKPRGAFVDQGAIDDSRRTELAGVQQINTVLEGVISSLDKARNNMETVSSTVSNANKLLDLWIRILSQTEHTQRLLLSEHWEGSTKDLADVEADEIAKHQEADRRKQEARERAEAREREAAAAEARRAAAEKKPARGIRKGASSRGASSSGQRPPSASAGRGVPAPRTTRGSTAGRYGSARGRGTGRGTGA